MSWSSSVLVSDENGLELYRDRPREEWPTRPDGEGVELFTRPLDVRALLAEAP
jgi:catechol 2,3-dioxygenase